MIRPEALHVGSGNFEPAMQAGEVGQPVKVAPDGIVAGQAGDFWVKVLLPNWLVVVKVW